MSTSDEPMNESLLAYWSGLLTSPFSSFTSFENQGDS
jgi:hypothetical protein